MAATTVLAYVVTRRLWGWSGRRSALVVAPLLAIDLAFFGSNLLKVHHGGWFPLLLGGGLFVLMTTWDRGRAVVTQKRIAEEGPLQPFVTALDHQTPPIERVPGMAVYLNASDVTTPLALRHNVRHNHVRHEHIVIFRAVTDDVPHVGAGGGAGAGRRSRPPGGRGDAGHRPLRLPRRPGTCPTPSRWRPRCRPS